MAQDGITFEGANGSAAGDSPDSPSTPYEGIKSRVRASHPSMRQEAGTQQPASPQPQPRTEQPAQGSGSSTPESTDSPTQGSGTPDLAGYLASQGIDVGGASNEEILKDVQNVLNIRDRMPSEQELVEYQQSLPQLQEYRNNREAFQQFLEQQQRQQQEPQQPEPTELEASSKFELGVEPIDFDLPELDSYSDYALRTSQVVYDGTKYVPANENLSRDSSVLAAVKKLNNRLAKETEFIQQFRNNPVEFAQRANARKMQEMYEYFEKRIEELSQNSGKISKTIEKQSVDNQIDSFLEENIQEFFLHDDKGNPKLNDSKDAFVPSPVGESYRAAFEELKQKNPDWDDLQLHNTALRIIEPVRKQMREISKQASKPAPQPQSTEQNFQQSSGQGNADPPAGSENSVSRRNRRLSFASQARDAAQRNGALQPAVTERAPARATKPGRLTLLDYVS